MIRLLVGTDTPKTSRRLVEYLERRVDRSDEVYVVNTLVGGDETSAADISEGEQALEVFEEEFAGAATVTCNQLVRGNEPAEDLLEAAADREADEFVIGIRKRSPVGKMVFGSTAQNLLLEAEIPVRCVPLGPE